LKIVGNAVVLVCGLVLVLGVAWLARLHFETRGKTANAPALIEQVPSMLEAGEWLDGRHEYDFRGGMAWSAYRVNPDIAEHINRRGLDFLIETTHSPEGGLRRDWEYLPGPDAAGSQRGCRIYGSERELRPEGKTLRDILRAASQSSPLYIATLDSGACLAVYPDEQLIHISWMD